MYQQTSFICSISPWLPTGLMTSCNFKFSFFPTNWQFLVLMWILISHLEAVQSVYRVKPGGGWDLWCHRSHYQPWWPESPAWATPLDLPALHKHKTEWRVLNHHLTSISKVVIVVSVKPHWTAGCCEVESTQCQPWCPRLILCSTPLLSDPGPGG